MAAVSSFTTPGSTATVPTITNGSGATNIISTSATLNGNLTSDGNATTSVTVYWGTTDGGITASNWAHYVPLGAIPVGPFSTNIPGLAQGTTYYYRCYASNSVGSSWAASTASFITPVSTAPSVTNASGATSITATSATLNGNVTSTGGENPSVTVYWGTTDGGISAASWAHNEPLGTVSGTFYKDILTLTPGTTYYYRCFASNSAGSSWAPSSSQFTTTTSPTSQFLLGTTSTSYDYITAGGFLQLTRFVAQQSGYLDQIR
ncbi:MAG: hypothetical protein PHO26_08455, partial [Dehalococcoidia bacterium]|nr:hypothetical protein [Dehalococcoidia bacterium]